jgi:SNF2 family DNA or RNA helicase
MTRVFKPHAYQLEAIDHIYQNPRCALWMPMGGGKTVSTLTALDNLSMVEDDVYPVLVLAPLRVARSTWPTEISTWAHLAHLKVSVITGTAAERKAALKRKADIYCCNWDNLQWLVETLKGVWPFKTVVCDEASKLKGFRLRQGAKRARALGSIAFTQITRLIELTGTPAPQGLIDLWGACWFLDQGERLGRTFSAFESRWFTKGFDGFSLKPLAHAQKEVEGKLKDLCLTVQGLPVDEPIFNIISVDLPPEARKRYVEMEKTMFTEIAGVGVEAVNAAAKTMKALQIASGTCIVDDEGTWEEVHTAKLEALDSVIEEAAGMPVLVAYHFRADLARLKKRYPKGRHLDADPKTIDDWNAGLIPVLFAHAKSAGHGINLAQGGNILCFLTLNWSLEEYMQIIERLGPMRQAQAGLNRPVFVHVLQCKSTVDELVRERLLSKRSVQEVLLAAMERSGIAA